MSQFARLLLVLGCLCALGVDARAAPKTVCTITVNSDDEREVLKASLPSDEFRFVELVERGRPDWLASACQQKVSCDVLVISGHFDGGTEFYTDRLDSREYLPVDEMERVACSESCPGLFTQLKEVYLFGCNTLNSQVMRSASAEVARSLVRAGHAPADADKLARLLGERHGESNRDRMRHIFKDVPVVYGFPGKAPLGRTAGPLLDRYLRAGGEFGTGRASPKLLASFAASSMTATAGMTDSDSRAGFRRDVCRFSDDRLNPAQKVSFLHELLGRDMAEVRMFLDHIERYSATLTSSVRATPAVAGALQSIAHDDAARMRYLEFARDADDPAVRVRMASLARHLGWLSTGQERDLVIDMLGERLAGNGVGIGDVDLACTLNKNGVLDAELPRLNVAPEKARNAGHAAVLACLGSADGRARVLRAWASPSADEVSIAQAYLSHRPLADVGELRQVTGEVARMTAAEAQVRALHALARHRLSDPESMQALTQLFRDTKAVDVQRAVAGVLIRADYQAIATPELSRALRKQRLKSNEGQDLVDAFLRRLDLASDRPALSRAAVAPVME